jgi:hypothetical protein
MKSDSESSPRLLDREAVRFIVPAYLLTQAVVLFAIFLVVRAGLVERHPEPLGDFDRHFSPFMFMDGEHYIEIARRGYQAHGREHLWAFFPLYPVAARWLGALVGSVPLAGVVISHASHLVSLFYLRGLARMHGDEAFARRAVVSCLLFPMAHFWQLFYTESLFFALTIACFYYALRGSWLAAGVCGALAAAARSPGLLLIPSLLFGLLHKQGYRPRFERRHAWLLLVALGGAVPFFLAWRIAHDPLLVVHAQSYWSRKTTFPFLSLAQAVQDIRATPIDWSSGAALQRELDVLAVFLMFYVTARAARFTDASLCVFALLSVLMPLSSGLVASILRYSMCVPTVYLVLAKDLERRRAFYPALALSCAVLVVSVESIVSGAPLNLD